MLYFERIVSSKYMKLAYWPNLNPSASANIWHKILMSNLFLFVTTMALLKRYI